MTIECNQVNLTKNGTHVSFITENSTSLTIFYPTGVKPDEYEPGKTYEVTFSVK